MSEQGTPALWRLLVRGNVFECFQPPKTGSSFGLLLPPKADPHLRSAKLNRLRLSKMRQKQNLIFATNAISFRRTLEDKPKHGKES